MKIQYLGHSCFKLTGSSGTTVITDPYKEIGYGLPEGLTADVVTVSHRHFDHDNTAAIGGSPRIIDKIGLYGLPGVVVTGIGSFHDDENGRLRGENIIYKFRMDGFEICHLGDVGERCTSVLAEKISPVDILLLPIGGVYTIDGAQAKEYVDRLRPKIVIPMHYKTKELSFFLDGPEVFFDLFQDIEKQIANRDVFEFSRDDFTEEKTKIIFMERTKFNEKTSFKRIEKGL